MNSAQRSQHVNISNSRESSVVVRLSLAGLCLDWLNLVFFSSLLLGGSLCRNIFFSLIGISSWDFYCCRCCFCVHARARTDGAYQRRSNTFNFIEEEMKKIEKTNQPTSSPTRCRRVTIKSDKIKLWISNALSRIEFEFLLYTHRYRIDRCDIDSDVRVEENLPL